MHELRSLVQMNSLQLSQCALRHNPCIPKVLTQLREPIARACRGQWVLCHTQTCILAQATSRSQHTCSVSGSFLFQQWCAVREWGRTSNWLYTGRQRLWYKKLISPLSQSQKANIQHQTLLLLCWDCVLLIQLEYNKQLLVGQMNY